MIRQRLAVARILGPHGVRGEVKIKSYSGEYDHLATLENVELVAGDVVTPAIIVAVRGVSPNVICAIKGIEDRESAGRLQGADIVVERQFAAPLAANQYYVADLVGCRVVSERQTVGTVRAVWDNGVTDFLEVLITENDGSTRSVNIPLRVDVVGDVDIHAATVELLATWVLA